jgi:hypothetical protein
MRRPVLETNQNNSPNQPTIQSLEGLGALHFMTVEHPHLVESLDPDGPISQEAVQMMHMVVQFVFGFSCR